MNFAYKTRQGVWRSQKARSEKNNPNLKITFGTWGNSLKRRWCSPASLSLSLSFSPSFSLSLFLSPNWGMDDKNMFFICSNRRYKVKRKCTGCRFNHKVQISAFFCSDPPRSMCVMKRSCFFLSLGKTKQTIMKLRQLYTFELSTRISLSNPNSQSVSPCRRVWSGMLSLAGWDEI